MPLYHRIINDRIEKSIKGRQIGHTDRGLLCISTTVVMLAGLVMSWCNLPYAKKFFIAAMLLWDEDDVESVIFYSVIFNSVAKGHKK